MNPEIIETTIGGPVSLEGIGLHTGNFGRVTFLPAPGGTGIIFRRIDLPGKPEIPARIENVCEVLRGTTLSAGGARVHTVEHLMSAVFGLGIDNLLVEIQGEEPPAMDGSSLPFGKALAEAGLVELGVPAQVCSLDESFWIEEGEKSIVYHPSDKLEVTFSLEYPNSIIPAQSVSLEVSPQNYLESLAFARTFGFVHEFEMLRSKKLALGGTLENAVVVKDDGKLLNPGGIRHEKEFALHKVLDLIGDLGLVGKRIRGHIVARKTGHAYNVRFAKKFCELVHTKKERKASPMMNIEGIMEILPHRFPFLLIDRILSIEPGKSAVGIKNVTLNEPFFQGHYPQRPVMPGVLLVEAMAQVAGVVFLSQPEHKGKLPFFVGIDNIRFRKPVVPGDRLEISVHALKVRGNTGKVAVEARVDGTLVTNGELMFTIV